MKLSVIIPCYNEADNIVELFNSCTKTFDFDCSLYEFIFVDDGSKDHTWVTLKKLYAVNSDYNIKLIRFSRNFGKDSAIYAGMEYSCGEYVAIIDADLQQSPQTLLQMLNILENTDDYEIVAAFQKDRNENIFVRAMKNIFYLLFNKLSKTKLKKNASDFRVFKRVVVNSIISMKEVDRFSKGIFSWVGFDTTYVPYNANKRKNGKSKWNLKKLINYAVNGIISFSEKLIKIPLYFSFVFSLFLSLYIVLLNKDSGNNYLILFFATELLQILAIGTLGLYTQNMHNQLKNRPIYIIREYVCSEKS